MKTSELKGRIFDIRRFSTHDGGGIRTTVFLKGCPLSCIWCHNPEGIDFARQPIWLSGRCIRCRICEHSSEDGGIVFQDDTVKIDITKNEDWDSIMDACPTGAIRWDSEDRTVSEVFEEIRKDVPFYAYDGGVTLSGGDPLSQKDFSVELLRMCRKNGIHTAIETELFAGKNTVLSVLPLCDLIYADFKLYDTEVHKKYTGKDNGIIKDNIKTILKSELSSRVVIRTPLIPGITATEKNISSIGEFLSSVNPEVKWELLNYNTFAPAKYPMLEKKYSLPEDLQKFSPEQMNGFLEIAKNSGITNAFTE